MTSASSIKGWCPGALRPMESGDGLIVRLRVTGGVLSLKQARAIAKASTDYGNGVMDLSSRANLQLRGVTQETWPKLIEKLVRYDLIDTNEDAESVRNVMASPLSGIDPTSLIDITPHVKALEDHLKSTKSLHHLPAKFGFLIDDGGAFPIKDFSTDINFEAVRDNETVSFAIRLAEAEDIALIRPEDLVKTADALAHYFINARRGHEDRIRRMKNLVEQEGARKIFSTIEIETFRAIHAPIDKREARQSPIGLHRFRTFGCLGLAAPFGRWPAKILSDLVHFAEQQNIHSLRLTPWRALLLPDISDDAAEEARALFNDVLITNPRDPRLVVAACSGKPACLHASVKTQEDALTFSKLFKSPSLSEIRLHVSGCEKGCAHPRSSSVTLIGREGLYDLVINGKANDTPLRRELDATRAAAAIEDMLEGDAA
ncbi:MAG: precorrin-3B synthase [Hyphomicrobiales bacterium]